MEENKNYIKYYRDLENNMKNELKSSIRTFKEFEEEMQAKLVTSRYETQLKIEDIENRDDLTLVFNGDKANLSQKMKDLIKKEMISELEDEISKQEEEANEEIKKAKMVAQEKCKNSINLVKENLNEELEGINQELEENERIQNENKRDLEEISKVFTTLSVKKESRIFKALDNEREDILETNRQLHSTNKKLKRDKAITQGQIESFEKRYNDIDFNKEDCINTILEVLYGKLADYSILLQEEEFNREVEVEQKKKEEETIIEQQQEEKLETKVEAQQEQKVETKVEAQQEQKAETKVEPKQEQKVETKVEAQQVQKVETKVEPKQEQKAETKVEPKQVQKLKTQIEPQVEQRLGLQHMQKSEQQPIQKYQPQISTIIPSQQVSQQFKYKTPENYIMRYSAKLNGYEIIDTKTKVKYMAYHTKNLDKITKDSIAEDYGIEIEDLKYVDPNLVSMWREFDIKYGTKKEQEYIESIVNPNKENKMQNIEYDIKGIYKNKQISNRERIQILKYADYANTFGIAKLKKGIVMTIGEKFKELSEKIRDRKVQRLDTGKIIADNYVSGKRKNKIKDEIKVTEDYNAFSNKIQKVEDKDELETLLLDARRALGEGKISQTEYSGIQYNVGIRRSELNRNQGLQFISIKGKENEQDGPDIDE